MRSLEEIKKEWENTNGFLASLTIDATNAQKLDLVIELLIGLHENQRNVVKELTQAKRDRRIQ